MFKDAVQTFAACFAATVVLTGCDRAPDQSAAQQAAAVAATANPPRWIELQTEDGAALTLLGEGGRQLMHLACLSDPVRFEMIGRTFQRYADGTTLILGVDDQTYALPVDAESETPGVPAVAAIQPEMIDRLARAERISALYTGQRSGPFEAPDAEVLTRFAATCRTLLEQSAAA